MIRNRTTDHSSRRSSFAARAASRGGAAALVGMLTLVAFGSVARADSPSDTRATYTTGNVTTCADIGLPNDTMVGSTSDANASDANVSGVVATNAGATQPGTGEELNVTITGSAVIDAVMVKGGNGYNTYTDATYLPPTLGPPQHYIAPLNNGGNVPVISHWFVCYAPGTQVPAGAIGGIGLAAVTGAGFIFLQRRRRHAAATLS